MFLRDTGYAQSCNDIAALSKKMGMKVSRLEDAPVPSFTVDNKHSLVSWGEEASAALGSVTWPAECTVFGPFDKSETLPKSEDLNAVPAVLSVGATRAEAKHVTLQGTFIDLQAIIGGALKPERNAYVYYRVQSKADEDVYFGGGADWWMQWWVNGKDVFNTIEKGNERADYTVNAYKFKVRLKQGKNIVVVRVASGSAGFVLAAGGPSELTAPPVFNASMEKIKKDEYTLAVVDASATVLSAYGDDAHAGFAFRDYGTYKTVFIGARMLSRNMIAALAKYFGAWQLTDPGTVSAACENLIMLHPLATGTVKVRLKKPASLVECAPGKRTSASALTHSFDLPAGGTYLFMVR